MDEQYRKVTMGGAPQRRYRDRFFVNLNKQVGWVGVGGRSRSATCELGWPKLQLRCEACSYEKCMTRPHHGART